MAQDTMIEVEDVVEYLERHPDFLVKHPQLLQSLELNHQSQGAISLVERQLKLLREQNTHFKNQNEMLHDNMHHLISTARANDALLHNCLQLHQALSEAHNPIELFSLCKQKICQIFELDDVAYKGFDNPPGKLNFVERADRDAFLNMMNYHFPDNKPLCGEITQSELAALFPDPDSPVRSVAFIPIGYKAKYGILVIGSRDKTHFSPGMGTLFLEFLADIITVFYKHINRG